MASERYYGSLTKFQTCSRCGGDLPPVAIWAERRNDADDCTGSVGTLGRCRAFERDELWTLDVAYWVVRDASGEYLATDGDRSPCSYEASEFSSQEEAEEACERETDRAIAFTDD